MNFLRVVFLEPDKHASKIAALGSLAAVALTMPAKPIIHNLRQAQFEEVVAVTTASERSQLPPRRGNHDWARLGH